METILIHWTKIDIEKYLNEKPEEYGLYQVYSTHLIYGSQSLVYIGKAYDQPIHKRLKSHDDYWFNLESDSVTVLVGRLIVEKGKNKVGLEQLWREQVDAAEKLLIYNCAPAYNSSSIIYHHLDNKPDVLLLNYGKRGQLPLELSTYYDNSIFWDKDNGGEGERRWEYFEEIIK